MAHEEREWSKIVDSGDEDAFRNMVEPHLPTLVRLARRELAFYVAQRQIHPGDFTPEEIAGETWINAWRHRESRPEKMSLRGWLLGIQHRVLKGLVHQQRAYRAEKAISLDEPLPPDVATHHTEEWFWDWYQPENELTWEDVTPASTPSDVELSLEESLDEVFADEDEARVLMMHDEFRMPLPEVAFTLNRSSKEVGDLLAGARASLRQRGVGINPIEEVDEPRSPDSADR